MAERIVSPGVFTQERDLSFLPEGVAQIGAAFVGPTTKGPAFIPTAVQGVDGFVTTFGEPDGTSYTGYAVKNYLQDAGTATVVRVLGTAGYSTSASVVYANGSAGKKVFAVLHPTIGGGNITLTSASGTPTDFTLTMDGGLGGLTASSLTTVENATSFISNYFGVNPQASSSYNGYVYAVFPDAIAQAGTGVSMSAELGVINLTTNSAAVVENVQYSNATTPWIKSQTIAGTKHNLFKVHTLSDGTVANKHVKISITGITPALSGSFGTFSLLVRDFNDTDTELNVLESFNNLTLDPSSPNYIARVIGNSVPTYQLDTKETIYVGDFTNKSKYIRIEMSEAVIPGNAVPYGFEGVFATVPGTQAQITTASFVASRWVRNGVSGYTTESVDKRHYYGFNFTNTTSLSYLAPVLSTTITGSLEFTLEGIADVPTGSAPFSRSIALDSKADVGYRRFTVPLQGGFDGINPAIKKSLGADITSTNVFGFDLSGTTSAGSRAYKRALDAISNADNVDFNLLTLPGVNNANHSYIVGEAIDLCETRGDAFYIVDLAGLNADITEVVNQAETLNTNYAAGYYPWVRINDSLTNVALWAPPSVVIPQVYAFSDTVGAEWFAPAGLNRGGIPGAIGVKLRLNQANRDILYEGKVNPIAQFPGQGICVWGQKTLQNRSSALDRVNVRRLLITVKKFIASSARFLVFEQNTEATRNRFLNIVNPYLAGVQQRSGLTAFRVIMDDTNNTPDVIDRNILQGAIYLQPTRTAEFIKLDFNILPTGATFDTI